MTSGILRAWNQLLALFRRERLDRDLNTELESHLEMAAENNVRRGMSPEEARRNALLVFGGVQQARELHRSTRGLPFLEDLVRDLQYAFRQAVKAPRFTLAAVSTLAIGIGMQTAVYSVIHAVLIDPYPYRSAMRMVHLHLYDKVPFPLDLALTGPEYEEFRKSPVLDGSIAEDQWGMALTGEELPLQVQVDRISPDSFASFFGVPAILGREFGPADGTTVAVLSYHFWKSHFGASSDVLGRPVQLDHQNYTILGILPRRFAWDSSDVYIPLAYSTDPQRVENVFARVRMGVSDQQAEKALDALAHALAAQTPRHFPLSFHVHLVHINEVAIGRFRGVLVILFVSVSLLLTLACVNVAILLVARGEARQAEIGLRRALGAGRSRIVEQLLTESVLISLLGGGCGVLVALACIRLVRHFLLHLPALFPPEANISLNGPVLLFSLAVSMLTGILCGLWPAMRGSRTSLRNSADFRSDRFAGRHGLWRNHSVLLTVQVAFTVLLLAWSGATLRKMEDLLHESLGYRPEHLATVSISLSEGDHRNWAGRVRYYEEIRRTIAADPSVEEAAISMENLPPSILDSAPVTVPGSPLAGGNVIPVRVGQGYISTLRIPLISGRSWTEDEILHASHFALINQAMKQQYWPHADPIGQTVVLNNGVPRRNVWTLISPGDNERYHIIGVVGNVPNKGLNEPVAPSVYLPYTMAAFDWFNLTLRTRGNTAGLLHRIREQVHRIDNRQAVGEMVTGEETLEKDSFGRERLIASVVTAFALMGLVFAASGIYCIQSYLVAQRTREIGVRIALGASRLHIIRIVTQSSLAAVVAGAGIGLGLSAVLSGMFMKWTSGNAQDPIVMIAEISFLLVVATLASIVPARLAATIAPMEALRVE